MTERAWRLAEHGNSTGKLLSLFWVKQLSFLNWEELMDYKTRAALPFLWSLKCSSAAGTVPLAPWLVGSLVRLVRLDRAQIQLCTLLHNVPPLPVTQGNEAWFSFCHVLWLLLLKLSCFCSPVGALAWVLVAPAKMSFHALRGFLVTTAVNSSFKLSNAFSDKALSNC